VAALFTGGWWWPQVVGLPRYSKSIIMSGVLLMTLTLLPAQETQQWIYQEVRELGAFCCYT